MWLHMDVCMHTESWYLIGCFGVEVDKRGYVCCGSPVTLRTFYLVLVVFQFIVFFATV